MPSPIVVGSTVVLLLVSALKAPEALAAVDQKTQKAVVEQLIDKHGTAHEARIRQGVRQGCHRIDDSRDSDIAMEGYMRVWQLLRWT